MPPTTRHGSGKATTLQPMASGTNPARRRLRIRRDFFTDRAALVATTFATSATTAAEYVSLPLATLLRPAASLKTSAMRQWTAPSTILATESSLIEACRVGDADAVRRLLVADGIDVNVRSSNGYTPLMVACQQGATAAAAVLLSDPRVRRDARNPWMDHRSAFHLAAWCGHGKMIRLCLGDSGFEPSLINARDRRGRTALMIASSKGHTEVVHALLPDERVDRNASDDSGDTALIGAARFGHSEVVALILADEGVNPNGLNGAGRSALMEACREGHTSVLKRFVTNRKCSPLSLDQVPEGVMTAPEAVRVYCELDIEELIDLIVHATLLFGTGRLPHIMTLAGAATRSQRHWRNSHPEYADACLLLSIRLQLVVGAMLDVLREVLSLEGGRVQRTCRSLQVLRGDDGQALVPAALDMDLKVFISLPVIQAFVQHVWLGDVLLKFRDASAVKRLRLMMFLPGFLLLWLLQVVFLLPCVALYPPLEAAFQEAIQEEHRGRRRSLYLLDVPVLKFIISFSTESFLAFAMVIISAGDERGGLHASFSSSRGPIISLLFIAASVALAEAWEFYDDCSRHGPLAYFRQPMNYIDALGIGLACAALIARLRWEPDEANEDRFESEYWRNLMAASLLLQFCRGLRVLLLWSVTGPFVLMAFLMMKDVLIWMVIFAFLLLGFASSAFAMFAGGISNSTEPTWKTLPPLKHFADRDCIRPDSDFYDSWAWSLGLLFESGLSGESYFDCLRASSHPIAGAILIYLFHIVVGIALLNMVKRTRVTSNPDVRPAAAEAASHDFTHRGVCYVQLIAMMTRSFDNVWEAQEVNCIFLYSHMVQEAHERYVPAPFNLLSLPFWLWNLCRDKHYSKLAMWLSQRLHQIVEEEPIERVRMSFRTWHL